MSSSRGSWTHEFKVLLCPTSKGGAGADAVDGGLRIEVAVLERRRPYCETWDSAREDMARVEGPCCYESFTRIALKRMLEDIGPESEGDDGDGGRKQGRCQAGQ